MNTNKLHATIALIFLIVITSCLNAYKPGNLIDLAYPISTKLNFELIKSYMDTLSLLPEHQMPEKWKNLKRLDDLDSLNNKRIYFKDNPEEMYAIGFNGVLLLEDVYNQKIDSVEGWVAEKSKMPKVEEERVKKRFETEVLNKIEMMAKKDGVPDSVIYFTPKW